MFQSTPIASSAAVLAASDKPSTNPTGPRAGRAKPRQFSQSYKERILAEYATAVGNERGALLRREGLYSAHIRRWSNAINSNETNGKAKRGRPVISEEESRIRDLEKEVTTLKAQLEVKDKALTDANQALEILGKGVAFLEALSSKNAK